MTQLTRPLHLGRPPVLLSATAFGQPPVPDVVPDWLEVRPRRSDFGYSGWRHRCINLRSALELVVAGRGRDAVVLAHAGLEGMVVGPLLRLLSPRTRLLMFDPLLPTSDRADRVLLRGWRCFHRILVIRRGDRAPLMRRAGISADRIRFVPYIVRSLEEGGRGGGYVYSAGYAHRDWPTLLAALEQSGLPAILATNAVDERSCPPGVSTLPHLPPEEGRRLAGDAGVVAAVLLDTELPAGPLVLLDAMAMGQVVVATDVNGTRDYVEHGVTGLLIPPGRPDELAAALERIFADPDEARRLGAAARRVAQREWSPERFIERLAAELAELRVSAVVDSEGPETSRPLGG